MPDGAGGQTTLIVRLIPELNRRGFSVSTIKHAHHNFDLDQPGKDSYEHRAAGAEDVLVASANRIALMRELRGAPEPSLAELLRLLKNVDLVLVEGFKRDPLPKIEVFRGANGKPPLYPEDANIVALISDLEQGAFGGLSARRPGVETRPSSRTGYRDEAIRNVRRPAALDRHVGLRPPRDDDSTRTRLPPAGPVGLCRTPRPMTSPRQLVLCWHAKPVAEILPRFKLPPSLVLRATPQGYRLRLWTILRDAVRRTASGRGWRRPTQWVGATLSLKAARKRRAFAILRAAFDDATMSPLRGQEMDR